MKKVLFGGNFDPIHLGHIKMAEQASKYLNADVIFIPAPVSIWKKDSVKIENKIEMVNIAIASNPRFSIDLFEINSGKDVNYSIDTIKHFKEKYPNDEFYYLIGTDQVEKFHLWKECEQISKLVQIVYYGRPGYCSVEHNVERFNMINIPGDHIDISSTEIKDLEKLSLDENVLSYIEKNKLYFISEVKTYLTESRFKHSLEVAHLAKRLAKIHKPELADKAYIAGLLHDIGKYQDNVKLMEESFPEYKDMPAFSYHQFIGAKIAKDNFHIEDQEILDAIKYHATGNEGMSELGMLIYASDKIEPTRDYDSSELIKAMEENPIEEGFKIVLKANKEFLLSKGKSILNELTSKCFNQYLND